MYRGNWTELGKWGRNGGWDRFVSVIVLIAMIRKPHVYPLLTGSVVLQWEEAILIKNDKRFYVIVDYYRATKEKT